MLILHERSGPRSDDDDVGLNVLGCRADTLGTNCKGLVLFQTCDLIMVAVQGSVSASNDQHPLGWDGSGGWWSGFQLCPVSKTGQHPCASPGTVLTAKG